MITTNPPCGATILMGINKNGTARGAITSYLYQHRAHTKLGPYGAVLFYMNPIMV